MDGQTRSDLTQYLFEKAYSRLKMLYCGEHSAPDITILSRFYQEKMILAGSELYMRHLDFPGRVQETANQKGEHIFVRGTVGASFMAYLLGATDINPLPRHEYCSHCHTTKFVGAGSPFDMAPLKCSCGAALETDGHNLPFKSNLKSILTERIQVRVSYAFFDEAKAMIRDEPGDPSIAAHITFVPEKVLDKYRELEKITGFKMREIGFNEQSLAFFRFMERDIQGIPHFDNSFVKDIWDTIKPESYDDLLKLIGLAHSTNIWKNNAEILFNEHRMSLREIPAYREDLYNMISERLYKKGIYDGGFAYEVTDKTMRGYYSRTGGVDEDTMLALLELGFDMDFIYFLSAINYMFTKAQGIAYLREAIAMMFYKTKFNKEYNDIML